MLSGVPLLRTENWELRTVLGYEDKPSRLFSHDFNDDSFVALPIEFGVEDLMPGTKVKLPVGDWDDDLVVNDQRFQMSVSVVFAGLVMPIVLSKGSQPLTSSEGRELLVHHPRRGRDENAGSRHQQADVPE